MSHLYARTKQFLKTDYVAREDLFKQLAEGQSPKTMMITCSDSRISPSLVTQTEPGELFIVRNAGNLVAPFSVEGSESSGEWATIEYALKVLKVQEIVLCGHSDCGAIKAVHSGKPTGLKAVDSWLRHAAQPEDDGLESLIARNVRTQVENLLSHPIVEEAVQSGRLSLHGWVYHIGSGKVERVIDTPSPVLAEAAV